MDRLYRAWLYLPHTFGISGLSSSDVVVRRRVQSHLSILDPHRGDLQISRWIEFVMNTPSHHRVHHATNPRYLDRNYAGTFIIWDRMFGTFTEEVEGEKIRYGIVKQLGTFNLLWSVFHEWIGIAQDLWSAPWRHKFSYLWRPPGWSHDGSRDTSDSIRAQWQAGQQTKGD